MGALITTNRRDLLFPILWVAIQLPFLSSAFRIDDSYFLAVTRQIYQHPFDPYGFRINWDGTSEWAFKTLANPPFVPAYLAAWHCLFPWNEISFHIAVLPFSLIALCAFGRLAQLFEVDSVTSQAFLCCSPAFFLGSQVVMQDVPMLCFFLLAVTAAIRYENNGSALPLMVSFLAAFCCPLAKYNGLVLVPVLVGLALIGRRKGGLAAIACSPLLAVALWSSFTWAKYGQNHFLVMAAFEKSPDIKTPLWQLMIGSLAATGLGVLPFSLLDCMAKIPNRRKTLWASTTAILPLLYAFGMIRMGYGRLSSILLALSVWLALQLIALTISWGFECYRKNRATDLILVVWILSGLAFQAGLLFSSVRYVLFLAPPAILLVLRQAPTPKRTLSFLMAANFLFVVTIAVGDLRIANGYREVIARQIGPLLKGGEGRLYFSGHWGFQYYSELWGGEPVDETRSPVLKAGDLMVVAKTAWPDVLQPQVAKGQTIHATFIHFNPSWLVRTVDCGSGANFYASNSYGCSYPTLLPFGFSRGPSETFLVYSLGEERN